MHCAGGQYFVLMSVRAREGVLETYTQKAPNRTKMLRWMRLEIPTAKQRRMQTTPVLPPIVSAHTLSMSLVH